jgi:putative redox protein
MKFIGEAGDLRVTMDATAPLGTDAGPSPKQLLLMSVLGCTAMDVIALMRKHKQNVTEFNVSGEGNLTETHPKIFKELNLIYDLHGEIDPEKAKEAVRLSMSQYCGVSAMVSKAVPIRYTVKINGAVIAEDHARFWT